MSFVSYAQNFEDVMLWRALKHVVRGFYIDIGAQDPVIDSVSLAFYEHGWRGIHVEPTQQYSTKLREARPDETVEQIAIGNTVGLLKFYEFEDTGLSTADPAIARQHQEDGYVVIATEVPTVSMDVLLDRYGDRDLHWLKLDVEGFEESVLESWRMSAVRPWVLVIESTRPGTQEQSHGEWEDIVLSKGYTFAYFDGLNRFYVHRDHSDLLPFFVAPPNIFDGFVLSGTASQPFYRLVADKAQHAEVKAQQVEAVLNEVYASRSWRITKPLRWTSIQGRLLREHGIKARAVACARRIGLSPLRKIARHLTVNSRLRQSLVAVAKKIGIYKKLRALYHRVQRIPGFRYAGVFFTQDRVVPASLEQLTPRARQIYADLKIAIERRQKEIG